MAVNTKIGSVHLGTLLVFYCENVALTTQQKSLQSGGCVSYFFLDDLLKWTVVTEYLEFSSIHIPSVMIDCLRQAYRV